MRNSSKGVLLAGGLIAVIVTAGFFHDESKPSACRAPEPVCIAGATEGEERPRDQVHAFKAAPAPTQFPPMPWE